MPDAPTSGRRKIYTGWKIVTTSAALWALHSMLWMQGFGNLAVELRDEFGWSITFFSTVFVATRGLSAILGPIHGQLIRKHGTTNVLRAGAIIIGIGMVGLSQIDGRLSFLAALTVGTIGISLAGFLTLTSAVVGWFEVKRARALSLQTMGFALGGFAGPLVVVGFSVIGWRWTFALSGLFLAGATWLASGFLGQDRAKTGEPLDGIDEADLPSHRAEGVSSHHFTAREAIRTQAFWMISGGHAFALVVVGAAIAHLALYLTGDRGYTAGQAALFAGLAPVFQFIGTAAGGSLGDRFNKRLIAAIAMAAHGTAMLVLAWMPSNLAVWFFVVVHGLAWGARGPQMQALRADYFGTTSFASIMGLSGLFVTMGSVAGPLIAGILADRTGDYRIGFTIISVIAFLGVGFWAFAKPPVHPASATASL